MVASGGRSPDERLEQRHRLALFIDDGRPRSTAIQPAPKRFGNGRTPARERIRHSNGDKTVVGTDLCSRPKYQRTAPDAD